MTARRATRPGAAHRRLIVAFVRSFIGEHGYSPTLRDIAAGVGCSTSTAQYHVGELVESGLLAREPGIPRSIREVTGE